jgi:hypothetical protein
MYINKEVSLAGLMALKQNTAIRQQCLLKAGNPEI